MYTSVFSDGVKRVKIKVADSGVTRLAVIMLGWGHSVGCLSFALALVRSNTSSRERSSFEQFQDIANRSFICLFDLVCLLV